MIIPTFNYAGSILVNQNLQILLVFSDGKWEYPHDIIKAGESIKQTALRAAVERTNVDPANIRILRELPSTVEMVGETIKNIKLIICEYETNPDFPLHAKLEHGIFEAKWFPISVLPSFAMKPNNKYIAEFLHQLFTRTPILQRDTKS